MSVKPKLPPITDSTSYWRVASAMVRGADVVIPWKTKGMHSHITQTNLVAQIAFRKLSREEKGRVLALIMKERIAGR